MLGERYTTNVFRTTYNGRILYLTLQTLANKEQASQESRPFFWKSVSAKSCKNLTILNFFVLQPLPRFRPVPHICVLYFICGVTHVLIVSGAFSCLEIFGHYQNNNVVTITSFLCKIKKDEKLAKVTKTFNFKKWGIYPISQVGRGVEF